MCAENALKSMASGFRRSNFIRVKTECASKEPYNYQTKIRDLAK
jgi:hypothetical protein